MSIIVALHVTLALMLALIGAAILSSTKGGHGHRFLGWFYVAGMMMLVISGLLIVVERMAVTPFVIFAVFTTVQLTFGLLAIWKVSARREWNELPTHYFTMAWSYAGLTLAIIAQAWNLAIRATVVPPGVGFIGMAAGMVVGTGVAWRLIAKREAATLAAARNSAEHARA